MAELEQFLQFCKDALSGDFQKFDKVHVVIGNDACDLDSAIAAISLAFYLHKTRPEKRTIHLPVLNIPRHTHRLRTANIYVLHLINITDDIIIFRDDIDLCRLQNESRLSLTLVDHNLLPKDDRILNGAVVRVVDHHVKECSYELRVELEVDIVGSCCTLVAERLIRDNTFILDDALALALYATILVDTINLSPFVGRTTQRDIDVIKTLDTYFPTMDSQQFYHNIEEAKYDLSGLSNMELLEMDNKMVDGGGITIVMCSITMHIEDLVSRAGFIDDLQLFCHTKGTPAVVIMTLSSPLSQNPQRQLAVFSPDVALRKQITEILETTRSPSLELSPLDFFSNSLNIYDQGNVQGSRKKVLPILKSYLRDRTNISTSRKNPKSTIGLPEVSLNFDNENNLSDNACGFTADIASIGDVNFDDFSAVEFSSPQMEISGDPREEFSTQISDNVMFFEGGLLQSSQTPDSGYSNPITPPNSRDDGESYNPDTSHELPSFNSAEMVNRIKEKKASLEQPSDLIDACANYPFTPPNSLVTSDLVTSDLVTSDISNRERHGDINAVSADFTANGKYPFTPHNSFTNKKLKDGYREDRGNIVDFLPSNIQDQVFDKQMMLEENIDDFELSLFNDDNAEGESRRSKSPFINTIQDDNLREILENGAEFCNSLPETVHNGAQTDGNRNFSMVHRNNDSKPEVVTVNGSGEGGNVTHVFNNYDGLSLNIVANEIADDIIQRSFNRTYREKPLVNGHDGLPNDSSVSQPSIQISESSDKNEAINIVAGYIARDIISSAMKRVSNERKPDPYPEIENEVAKNIIEDMRADGIVDVDDNCNAISGKPGDDNFGRRVSNSAESDSFLSTSDYDVSDGEMEVAGLIAAEIRSNRFSTCDIWADNTNNWPENTNNNITTEVSLSNRGTAERDKSIHDVAQDLAEQIVSDAKQKYVDQFLNSESNATINEHYEYYKSCSSIERLSYLITADIITSVLDNFPVFEIYKKEILTDSDYSSTEKDRNNSNNSPTIVETDYLPKVDQYKGDIKYATTYSTSLKKYIRNMSLSDPSQDMAGFYDDEESDSPPFGTDSSPSTENLCDKIEEENLRKMEREMDVTTPVLTENFTQETDNNFYTDVDKQNKNPDDLITNDRMNFSISKSKSAPVNMNEDQQSYIWDLPSPQTNYGKTLINSTGYNKGQLGHNGSTDVIPDSNADNNAPDDDPDHTSHQKRAVYMTSAGRMSISMDSMVSCSQTTVQDTVMGEKETNHQDWWDTAESDLTLEDIKRGHKRGISSSSIEAVEKMRDTMFTQEYPDEQEDGLSDVRHTVTRPATFDTLLPTRHKLIPEISITVDDNLNGVSPSTTSDVDIPNIDDLETPDDLNTPDDPDDLETPEDGQAIDESEWEKMALLSSKLEAVSAEIEARNVPDYSIEQEVNDRKHWMTVTIGDTQHTIDVEIIEPYKKVLLHAGYISEGTNVVIMFCGCYLPDKHHEKYQYIMENLFLYILYSLDQLIVQDYTIVYFHGATPKSQTPSFSWLRRCYQMIDRRLKKTLRGLMLVHPTLWLKTVVLMSRPFISSNFSSNIRFVRNLAELEGILPMEQVLIPQPIKSYDEKMYQLTPGPSPPASPTKTDKCTLTEQVATSHQDTQTHS